MVVFKYLVEGLLCDLVSFNKFFILFLFDFYLVGLLLGLEVYWGLVWGVLVCVVVWVFLCYSVFGFVMGVVGGNVCMVWLVGLLVNWLILMVCVLGGVVVGLVGMFEVSVV